jgi:acyl transferase domain-containing protein
MKSNQKFTGFEIAVIGVSCRLPGANNWRSYWDNLVNQVESIEFLLTDERSDLGIADKNVGDLKFVNAISPLKNKDLFDSAFFDYRPAEALLMNPAHRVFHECLWEALEDAGCNPETTKGLIGIYAGAGNDLNWQVYSTLKNRSQNIDGYTLSYLNNKDYLSSLLSYKLNLKGPSVSFNTACSTSLVAINNACKALLLGETNIALAGGVSIVTQKQKGYFHHEGAIYSQDGHCRAFDIQASGTISGEGAGVVVLKRLVDAIKDGDHIYSIIKGGAVNNDGNRKVGFTAPSIVGQVECIKRAQQFSKVAPNSIGYIETHGTGTRLGDPIEVEALNEAFGGIRDKFCAIGSVKTNIGHLDTTAGVAGLIKAVLSLKHKQIPASLHFKEANPEIDFAGGPFYVNTSLKAWERVGEEPLRAGVSSFGIGGTNVHVILEEAPEPAASDPGQVYQLLTLSAKTESSLTRYIQDLRRFVQETPDINLADMSYTLQTGRKHFHCRKSIVYHNREELLHILGSGDINQQLFKSSGKSRQVVFMFPGQGTQYAGMCRELYHQDPLFKQEMDKGFALIERLTGERFADILFSAAQENHLIHQTQYTQPLVFLMEYSLARLILSMGIAPQYMIGHSLGEYVAACLSGLFSFEDALKLVVKRGELMSSLPGGSMVSIAQTESEAKVYINVRISIAAVNSPGQVVLSGDTEAIDDLIIRLIKEEIPYVKLITSHAFHSVMQEPIQAAFRSALEGVRFNKMQSPFISNLTGDFISGEDACSIDYWVRHMREPVLYSAGIKTILSHAKECVFIEIGAGHSLSGLLKQHSDSQPLSVNLVRHFKEEMSDMRYLATAIGKLWSHGIHINWEGYYKNERRQKVSLPTYSFDPIRYPAEVDPFDSELLSGLGIKNKLGGKELKDWIYYPSWKRSAFHATDPAMNTKGYLFFSFEESFSSSVSAELLSFGNACVEVLIGDQFQKLSNTKYIIDPVQAGDFGLLLNELQRDQIVITDIVYAWGMGVASGNVELERINVEINRVYFSLVSVIQALLNKNDLKDKRISVLTDSLHQVIGVEKGSPAQSLLLGLVNVLPQEYSVSCINIDIHLAEGIESICKKLAEEISSNSKSEDRIVALRYGQRWIQEYQKNDGRVPTQKSVIKQGGIYLITGGLGNVGFVLAKYLAKTYGAKLVLTGRKAISNETGSALLSRLNELKSLSPDITYVSADVSDSEAFQNLVIETERTTGGIDGVIHTAGIIDTGYFELVEDMSAEKALTMFAPKIRGIENIYETFKTRNPDFVWITSSLATVLGGLGFGAYSSANLYMDHFVLSRSEELKNWRSIGLAGMVFTDQEKQREHDALNPSEIAALFEWSLTDQNSRVILENKHDLSQRVHEIYGVKGSLPE